MSARAHPLAALALLGAAAVAGCAQQPVSVEQAERICLAAAYDAISGPRGNVAVGVGGGRHWSHSGVGVSVLMPMDQLMRRDPADAFAQCVKQRSGQMPTRPLYEQPGWRG